MRCRRLMFGIALLAVGVSLAIAAAPAQAIGYWNLPGNGAQWWGYGNGPGYHAPMILGPHTHEFEWYHRVVRLPYAPQPPYGYYGCAGGGCGESSLEAPSHAPVAAPVAEPTPAAFRPQILR